MEIQPIAHFESPFSTKFGIPRQSGLVPDLTGWYRRFRFPVAGLGVFGQPRCRKESHRASASIGR